MAFKEEIYVEKYTQNQMSQNSEIKLLHNQNIVASDSISTVNDIETEKYFRRIFSQYENQNPSSDLRTSQTHEEYIDIYHQISSLYFISDQKNLIVYDTENEYEEVWALETKEKLDSCTCIAQLPNGELFCFGNSQIFGITLIIDMNSQTRLLPSGTPCCYSSAIYFNRNVYCFGGESDYYYLTLSERFDLDQNLWIKLSPLPVSDTFCHCILSNRNILISGYESRKIRIYSIDIDSFSTIPYNFTNTKFKLLAKSEKFYLIESGEGWVYESGLEDEYSWSKIAKSTLSYHNLLRCSYNKGSIYIGYFGYPFNNYYKFCLSKKVMIDLKSK